MGATMTTAEAGDLLRVSRHQVAVLARTGELGVVGRVGNSIILDAASVYRLAQQEHRRGRPWDAPTAWAAVDLLNGWDAPWVGGSQRSRLRSALRGLEPTQLVSMARRRASDRRFRASRSFLPGIQEALVPSGIADIARLGADVGLSVDHGRVEGYTDPDGVADIVGSFLLVPDPSGNVLIHEALFGKGLSRGPSTVLTALDLAGSLDVRERSAGLRVLDRLLAVRRSVSR
jgi:hypothetical protein